MYLVYIYSILESHVAKQHTDHTYKVLKVNKQNESTTVQDNIVMTCTGCAVSDYFMGYPETLTRCTSMKLKN